MSGVATQKDVLAVEAMGMPADLPESTYEMIRRRAAIDPKAPALSFFHDGDRFHEVQRWTYGKLIRDITRTANFFRRLGVERGSVIAYVLPNLPETHFVIWGGEATGIVCAINPLLETSAIADILKAVRARVVVTLAPFPGVDLWPKVLAALDSVPTLRDVVLVDPADRVRGVRKMAAHVLGARERLKRYGFGGLRGAVPEGIRIHDFGSSIARQCGTALDGNGRIRAGDLSSYYCTGGTTGAPKIAARLHGNEVANAWSVAQFFGDSVGPGKTIFCGLPLFHVNAVMVTGLVPFYQGAHVVLGTPQGFRGHNVVKRFWDIVEYHRINFFSGVPTLFASLLDVPVRGQNIASLEYGLCGAAPMPVEVFRAFQDRTGLKILEGYGLTEGTCVSSANPPRGERRVGSVGLRVPGQDMKAVFVDEAGRYIRDCQRGETGLLVISGPNVFPGYVQFKHNANLWLDLRDGQHWLDTGDLGYCDRDGYFWLTGRKKDLIIRGGHNIDPANIEEPLHRHPAVRLAAAVGRPDMRAGELPVAYVQLKPGTTATEAELMDFAHGEIAERAAHPRHIRIIDAIPLTAVGKIFKPDLRRREIADALRDALLEAGVTANVIADADGARGTVVRAELADAGLEPRAAEILGRFPFAFTLSTTVQPALETVGPEA